MILIILIVVPASLLVAQLLLAGRGVVVSSLPRGNSYRSRAERQTTAASSVVRTRVRIFHIYTREYSYVQRQRRPIYEPLRSCRFSSVTNPRASRPPVLPPGSRKGVHQRKVPPSWCCFAAAATAAAECGSPMTHS